MTGKMPVLFEVDTKAIKLSDFRYLHFHSGFYTREMKIKAYGQLLESYRSLTLEYMAVAFGVAEDYIDQVRSRTQDLGIKNEEL